MQVMKQARSLRTPNGVMPRAAAAPARQEARHAPFVHGQCNLLGNARCDPVNPLQHQREMLGAGVWS